MLKPWETASLDNRERGGYLQVGTSLFEHAAFQALTPAQRYLYLCMAQYAKGRIEFEFPQACFKRFGIAHGTARAGIVALIDAGFIEKDYCGRIAREKNRYRFSLRWKCENAT